MTPPSATASTGAEDDTGAPSEPDVLVIEDDVDVRELVASRLRRLGCEVRGATTGEDGLAQALDATPDLVVLDVLLPGIDGWEVLRRLRANPDTAHAPVLVLSITHDEPPAGLLPPGRSLPKPFAARTFNAAVTELLAGGTS